MFYLLKLISFNVFNIPRFVRQLVVLFVDASLCILSVWLSFYLRLGDFLMLSEFVNTFFVEITAISILLALPIFALTGLYREIFRYSGISALLTLTLATVIYASFFSTIFTFYGVQGVPRTFGLIQPFVLFFLVGVSRFSARFYLYTLHKHHLNISPTIKVMIYGAGSAGRQIATVIANNNDMSVEGFLDDDHNLHGHHLNGLRVYNPKILEIIAKKKDVTTVLLAMPSASREKRNEILKSLSKLKISVRTLPKLTDIASGKVSLSDVHELDIEDLLDREPVIPNEMLLNQNTNNKTVLITGAGGSIGSELCRQVLKRMPSRILLVDMSEFALYQINQEILSLREVSCDCSENELEVVPLLASVCDEVRMQEIMDTWRPDTVYHAAAYKHVPLVEHNPAEGIRNNVWGTKVCAEAAVRNGVQNFVLISTDKAVRPTNVMGASKRLAEMVLQALNGAQSSADLYSFQSSNSVKKNKTCFSMVRFGNVLGSSGSVVPLFREQIKKGGPITLTHPDITRFFMTIQEAAQLVIQAGAMGFGGDVFVLDMGKPVRIYDLAIRMVELSGLTIRNKTNPHGDIEIMLTGLRPGEKLYEEILIGDNPIPTQHPRILKAEENFEPWGRLQKQLEILRKALIVNDMPSIRDMLQQLVAGYRPDGEVADWVYLAQERQSAAY